MAKIKTKKDLLIEALEKDNSNLKYELRIAEMRLNEMIAESKVKLRLVCARTIIEPPEIPIEYVKRRMAEDIAREIEPYIHFDVVDEGEQGYKALKGYLQVKDNRRFWE